MTLAYRLARKLAPRVVLGYARRMADASGFRIAFEVLPGMENPTCSATALAAMNSAIERLIESDPAQYQWEYKRFKRPASAAETIY